MFVPSLLCSSIIVSQSRMKLLAMTISRRNLSSLSPSTTAAPSSAAVSKRYAVSYLSAATRSYSQSKRRNSEPEQPPSSTSSSSSSSPLSSKRGRAAVHLLPSYLADARAVEQYSPSNPAGALQLGVAESQLLEDWLVPALNTMPPLSADAIYYQPTPGRADFKASFAAYVEELCGLEKGRLDTDGLVVGAGCNAVLENLCFTLADAGDAILIPKPYYAAFEFDTVARAGLSVVGVDTESYHPEIDHTSGSGSGSSSQLDPAMYYPNAAALDAAYERAALRGSPPKILLLSHPMNPLGVCYPASTVQECIEWCRERQVHLISDEIYAGSVYGETFESALTLAGPSLGPYVHWVYALSKDFCLSGLRVGVAYSENPEIRLPLQKLNDLCQISSQTQIWTASALDRRMDDASSEKWVTAFRRENHQRLQARCDAVSALLDKYQIPYLAPTAGLFLWMDLSQYLPVTGTPSERERALYLELVQQFGLLLTPGDSMRNERPGFFRCVFTAASEDEFAVALQRLETFCKAKAA